MQKPFFPGPDKQHTMYFLYFILHGGDIILSVRYSKWENSCGNFMQILNLESIGADVVSFVCCSRRVDHVGWDAIRRDMLHKCIASPIRLSISTCTLLLPQMLYNKTIACPPNGSKRSFRKNHKQHHLSPWSAGSSADLVYIDWCGNCPETADGDCASSWLSSRDHP